MKKELYMTEEGFVVKNGELTAFYGDWEDLVDESLEYRLSVAVPTIKKEAMKGLREYIRKIVIPEGVEKIGPSCFEAFRDMREVILPSTLQEIGDSAFSNCSNLKKLEIPDSVTKIGMRFMMQSKKIADLTLPRGLELISDSTLEDSAVMTLRLTKQQLDMSILHGLSQNLHTPIYRPFGKAKYLTKLVVDGVEYNGKKFKRLLNDYDLRDKYGDSRKGYLKEHQFTVINMFHGSEFFDI